MSVQVRESAEEAKAAKARRSSVTAMWMKDADIDKRPPSTGKVPVVLAPVLEPAALRLGQAAPLGLAPVPEESKVAVVAEPAQSGQGALAAGPRPEH